MAKTIKAAKAADLAPGRCLSIEADGRTIAIYNVGGELFATDAICTHEHAVLTEGELDEDVIICPLHFAEFNVRTGEATSPPATEDLQTYPVRIEDEDIVVEVE